MGEGGFAKRRRVRGSLREHRMRGEIPLIRRFAPPSPTRGEGEERQAALLPRAISFCLSNSARRCASSSGLICATLL
ncbi:MAG: hypothetical protein C0480_16075 [Bradyrhizobium sp.]|nr:hypothetical protein [Bradyrhizobium sp.]